MHAYSQDLRDRAIKLCLSGNYTKKSLSELLSIGYKTLRKWVTIYEMTGNCKIIKSSAVGRKRLFNDKAAILDYLKLHPAADGKDLRNALTSCCTKLFLQYSKSIEYNI